MEKALRLNILILSLLIAVGAYAAPAKDDWIKVQSKNFTMVGNAEEKELRRIATRLEQFREAFRLLLPNIKLTSPIPTTGIVFKSDKTFEPYKPVDKDGDPVKSIAGYFRKSDDINYIALSTEGEDEQTYRIIFHEYTHFLIDNSFGRSKIPPWLNEGLAEYYGKFRIEGDQTVTLGVPHGFHLTVLGESRLIPMNTLLNTDYYSLHTQEWDRIGIFYAESWALIHYLLHSDNGSRRPLFGKFVNLLVNGKKPNDALQEVFNTDFDAIETGLKGYVSRSRFPTTTVTFKEKLLFDSEMQTIPLDEADTKAILGDLLLHGRRYEKAEELLRKALALKPASVQAHISLGMARLGQNDPDQARKFLRKAIELDENSALAHYQYAYVLSREGMTAEGFVSGYTEDLAGEARAELKKAIELNPGFAESYALYTHICAVRNECIDEAIGFMQKALAISPGNQRYLVRLAEILARKEDFAEARAIVQRVFETASDPRMKLYAKATLARIDSTEEQLKGIKNQRRADESVISEKPLTEEEIARRNRLAVNEGLNKALRKPRAGELRVLGYITKIECGGGRIEFTLRTADQTRKFSARDFESLFLMSFTSAADAAEIGCGTIKKEVLAVITYTGAPNTKTAGEILAIEFMPADFKLM